jgi:hypothetical protein
LVLVRAEFAHKPRIFGRANATLTNFEVDQTGSAFAYNVSSVN